MIEWIPEMYREGHRLARTRLPVSREMSAELLGLFENELIRLVTEKSNPKDSLFNTQFNLRFSQTVRGAGGPGGGSEGLL